MLMKYVDGDLDQKLKFREFRQLFKRESLPAKFKTVMKVSKEAFLQSETATTQQEPEEPEAVVAIQSSIALSSKQSVFVVGGLAILAVVALFVTKRKKEVMPSYKAQKMYGT